MRLPKLRPLLQKIRPPRSFVAGCLQVFGIAGIATGVGMVEVWAGVIVGSTGLVLLGIATENAGA